MIANEYQLIEGPQSRKMVKIHIFPYWYLSIGFYQNDVIGEKTSFYYS